MNKVVFAIRDAKAGAFATDPMCAPSRGVAERAFRERVNDPEYPFAKWPGDYELWFLGEFNPVTGVIEGIQPEFAVNGAQLVSRADSAQLSLSDDPDYQNGGMLRKAGAR